MLQPAKMSRRITLVSEPALIDTSLAGDGSTREGWVGTKHGIVLAYVSDSRVRTGESTVLRYSVGGRVHTWTWHRAFSERQVGKMAAQMARELSGVEND
jgi:hypothetical protein